MTPLIKQAAEILLLLEMGFDPAQPLLQSDEFFTREDAPSADDLREKLIAALEVFAEHGIAVGDQIIYGAAVNRGLTGLIKTAAMFDREIAENRRAASQAGPEATRFTAKMILRAHGHARTYTQPEHLPHFYEGVRAFIADELAKYALSYAQGEPAYLTAPKLVEIAQSMLKT